MTSPRVCIIGEVLVDLVGTDVETPLADCRTFRRQVGGSCANVARFLAALGTEVDFVSGVGLDGLGDCLVGHLDGVGVATSSVVRFPAEPTTVVVVNKTVRTPQFVVHLGAHTKVTREHVPAGWLEGASLLHVNGFCLARSPLRETILALVDEAVERSVPVSFDPNWREVVWPDRPSAMRVIEDISRHATYMKPSLDDARELFGEGSPDDLADRYRAWGARCVVLTMGGEGALVVDERGRTRVPARGKLTCATGAGDAFWSLFLHASLSGKEPVAAADEAAERICGFLEENTH